MSKYDVTDTYAPCPRCSCTYAKRVNKVLLVGIIGDALFHPVKCINCCKLYNGKTGEAVMLWMLLFALGMLCFGVAIWWYLNGMRF